MQLSVVILAAGQGKRMNSDLPKVLQPLAGRPLLRHVIDAAHALNPAAIYVVYGHGGAQVQAAFEHEPVEWILQAEQLGTGHAVMQAMCVIPDEHAVLVLYGDVPMIQPGTLSKLVAAANSGALALLTVEVDDASGYGRIVRDAAGQAIAIVEHSDADAAQLQIKEINSGLMAAPGGALREWLLGLGRNNNQREYFLTDVVAGAVAAGTRVEAILSPNLGEVSGVNDKLQLAQVEANYRRAKAEALMQAGATLADPARIDIRGDLQVGRDVFIDVNSVFIGNVQLGSGVKIGPNCVIQNSRVGNGTEIHANSVLDQAVVAEDCRVGPFARLRPGTVMQREVHIGNFVEVKNTEIGAGSKANHLTYLGDSTIGKDVNVGAGSITCNYDGANKWPTIIEDDVFIGSGSMLVAPLRIGAGSNIGAGSTITKSTPDNKLSLGRARQVSIDQWQRPEKLQADAKQAVIEQKTKKPKG